MRNRFLAVGKFAGWVACILGGLASFLQWLGVKPRDLAMTQTPPLPHVLWLLFAIALFAVGIGSSIWAGITQKRTIANLEADLRMQGGRCDIAISAERLTHQQEIGRMELQHNAELERARECYRQCMEEKSELNLKLEEEQKRVKDSDPRAYLSLQEPGEVPGQSLATRLVIANRGGSDAHNVKVHDMVMRSATIRFDGPIGVIAAGDDAPATPTCDRFGPAFSRNILMALKKEAETYEDIILKETISVPIRVTYADFRGVEFETTCDLIYHAIRDALKQTLGDDKPSVEFHNFTFRKVVQ